MKALNLYGIGDLRLDEAEKPVPKAGEVLLRVKACGICGSDIPRVYSKGTYHFPTILGHEFAGVVEEAEDASLVGRAASVFPLLPCGTCEACETGRYAQCKDYSYYGSREDGGMAEFLAVKRANLCLLPEGVSLAAGAMTEPAAVALHALRKGAMRLGDRVLIYGIGAIGVLAAEFARASGAAEVILVGRTEDKLRMAKERGFSAITAGDIEDRSLTESFDLCIEGTGSSEAVTSCARAVRAFGRIVLLGNPAEDMHLSMTEWSHVLRKEICLSGTWNSSFQTNENDWKDALHAMQQGWIHPEQCITHRYRIEDYEEAFLLMKERREPYLKVMLTME